MFLDIGCYNITFAGWNNTKTYDWTFFCNLYIVSGLTFILRRIKKGNCSPCGQNKMAGNTF